MTPKVHPEIAGVGIEYDWGYAKLKYRKEINDGIASRTECETSVRSGRNADDEKNKEVRSQGT
jgi:hypothetical protein